MSQKGSSSVGWRWLVMVLTTLLVAGLLLMAACGGDSEDEEQDSDSEPTATEQADDGDGEEPEDEEGDGDNGDAASALNAFTEDYEGFTGKVTYEISGTGDGSVTTMTIYRSDDASRVDYEGDSGTGSIITTGDGSYFCSDEQCLSSDLFGGIDPTAAFTELLSAEAIGSQFGNVPDGVDVDESDQEIAGMDAKCYTYAGPLMDASDESAQVCFSESGLLLRLDLTDSGGGTFEAVEAADEVSDDDFEPPFPVTELPNIGQ